jgi:hypothetical protein
VSTSEDKKVMSCTIGMEQKDYKTMAFNYSFLAILLTTEFIETYA